MTLHVKNDESLYIVTTLVKQYTRLATVVFSMFGETGINYLMETGEN